MKQGDGPTLVTQGSSELIQTSLANNLIDEIAMFTFLSFGQRQKAVRWWREADSSWLTTK